MNEDKNKKRAIRRHHKDRMKSHAKHVVGIVWRYLMGDTKNEAVVNSAIKDADHLKSCDCDACKNPRRSKWRKNKGKTLKEIQRDREGFEE